MLHHKGEPAALDTERRSEATVDIDLVSIKDGLILLAHEFTRPFDAFTDAVADLAPVVEAVVTCVREGRSVHLFGAGTSGRLAALDAAEIPPTFGVSPNVFRAHLAGGLSAMTTSAEDAEDDAAEGAKEGQQLEPGDVAIGVTASGSTPFVLAALEQARLRGAYTALIDCNGSSSVEVDSRIVLKTGPEPIAGSTRLNAATAQKLALNAISTLSMIHLGRSYSNLMVCVQPTNAKLRQRLSQLLVDISGRALPDVEAALLSADNDGRVALAMLLREWDAVYARAALEDGRPLREALSVDPL